ncbi:MAG: hypothetical protein AVO33_08590 [delta proteobacterium ML8_F1]|nr:MAG: hypothetical protein AVO33_08590 [delta proteobacterium ML8_F1]
MDELMRREVLKIIESQGKAREALIPVLKAVQRVNPKQYIPQEVSQLVASTMGISESEVYEVVSFYAEFSEKPRARNVIRICDSTVCRVTHHRKTAELLEAALGIRVGEATEDGVFCLEYSPCFGACDVAPAIRINDRVYGNLDGEKLEEILQSYRR